MPTLARYTIHLPLHDEKGNSLRHVLPSIRRLLTQNNLHGRMVQNDVEADWGDNAPQLHALITLDAGDSPQTDELIKSVASQAKEIGELEGVYVTKIPISQTWVV